jgi:branched-chain amino acid transport system substrate-binding protein
MVVLALVLGVTQAQTQPTFRIGVLDGVDGALARGVQLAVDQINAAGGVRGADGTQFQLLMVLQSPDPSGSYARAIDNVRSANVVAVVGPSSTADVQANLDALLALDRPILTPALSTSLLLDDQTNRLFRNRARGALTNDALANVIVRDLGLRNIRNVLLDQDPEHLEGLVAFSTVAQQLGAQATEPIIEAPSDSLVQNLLRANPQAIALFGAPALANEVTIGLRNARYTGIIAYNNVEHPQFRDLMAPTYLDGLLSGQTWSYSLIDDPSAQFTLDYVRATGQAPNALAASAYDGVLLIVEALERPGELRENLSALEPLIGVQGRLAPSVLPLGEVSDSAVVVRHLQGGGQQVLARFISGQRTTDGVPSEQTSGGGGVVIVRATPTPAATSTPVPSPTLDGLFATVVSQVLNVRTGPGTNYDVLGQLRQNETVRIIGGNTNLTWAVIEFRGQQGWISTDPSLTQLTGDRRTVPVIAAPPSPTPGPTSTPAPSATPSTADLTILGIGPSLVNWNTPTNLTVTVRNGGGAQSGGFTIAGGFNPGPVVASVAAAAPGLAPAQQNIYTITVTLTGATGFYASPVTVDFLGEVNEGGGEGNNTFQFNYKLDRPVIFQGALNVANGNGFNLDGTGGNDITYSGGAISVTCGACVVSMTAQGLNFESTHHDIVASSVNASSIGVTPGTVIGVKTDGGKFAVLRIDAADAGSVTFTYRVYQ